MVFECEYCQALHWLEEAPRGKARRNQEFSLCCVSGDGVLDALKSPPPYLRMLFTDNNPAARSFRQHIRKYNMALAFTSVSYNKDIRFSDRGGIQVFRIQGELFHYQGPLIPGSQDTPCFAQLFFYDPEYATDIRMQRYTDLDRGILSRITQELLDCNPFISIYKTARERLAEDPDPNLRIVLSPQMHLIIEKGADRRRENLPTSNEVAVVLPDEMESGIRELVLAVRNPGFRPSLEHVHVTHASYMPLAYTLLFPQGDYGWHYEKQLQDRSGTRKKLRYEQQQFYRARLHIRKNEFSTLFYAGRLFQQYVVDAFTACECTRLNWIRSHQQELRADVYNGLQDALHREDVDLEQLGHRYILPSSFTGGDRAMQQLFQDSMAIVRTFGKPSIFITFTANPQWPEITDNLLFGQKSQDRPDLIVRVFYLKVKEMLSDLKRGILGPYAGHVYTIEYQKRGLPHQHLLLFLQLGFRINTPQIVDQIVCAELPDPSWDPTGELTDLVLRFMIHGPCGIHCPTAPCMVSKNNSPLRCQKGFPKPFASRTTIHEDSYPEYRRRNNGRTFTVRNPNGGPLIVLDNRWVVPYNPYLLQKYQSHINVEVCGTVGAVKYIHKYIYKGPDRTTLAVQHPNDEIGQYLQCRYLGPSEAIWRLFEFKTHGEYPAVQRLSVHTEGFQTVYFGSQLTSTALATKMENSRSTLMAFFEYNRLHEDGRHLLYQDFPRHYTWDDKHGKWIKRKRKSSTIGRIYHCNPLSGERYYLRMLLTAVCGPQSFADLYNFEGVTYPTYHAACIAQGLADNDQEWFQCFEEAILFTSGSGLRMLFLMGIGSNMIADPLEIWNRYKYSFCDDLTRRLQQPGLDFPLVFLDPQLDYGLYLLAEGLANLRMTLAGVGLPVNLFNWNRVHSILFPQFDPIIEMENADNMISQLNVDQLACFHTIVAAIRNDPQTAHFYLQGPGGTGKTFLYKTLCYYFRGLGKSVLCVASTGIAALLLPNGRTSHTTFRIPIELNEDSVCSVAKDSKLGLSLKEVDLIIWDEVPMQHKYCFEAVNRLLADLRSVDEKELLFGGIPVIFGGDFAQILPVVPQGSRADIVKACLQKSPIWLRLKRLYLRINMRVRNCPQSEDFIKWIGSLPYEKDLYGHTTIPSFVSRYGTIEELLDTIYPPSFLEAARLNFDLFKDRAILTAVNSTVAELNQVILDRFPGPVRVYRSVDSTDINESGNGVEEIPVEYLQTIQLPSLPPSILTLKVGVPVMLLRNLLPEQGLCNGTRMVVTSLRAHCLEVRLVGGDFHGQLRTIPRIRLMSSNELVYSVIRKQFPIRLAFAMTINKSQGQSFNHVGVDLRSPVFSHGQFYVAVSRVSSPSGLHMVLDKPTSTSTENVVWPEVLNDIRGENIVEEH